MAKKKDNKQSSLKRKTKLIGDDRIIDLLERIGVSNLYLNTDLGQNSVAKILGMDNNRANEILKGIKKTIQKNNNGKR